MLRRFPGQLRRALGKDQRVDQLIHVAIDESLKLIQRQADARWSVTRPCGKL